MPKNKFLRLVIDTNLWVSFLISNRLRKLDSLLFLEKVHFVFSKELLDEINSTITKPKLQKHFTANAFEEMLLTLEPYIKVVDVKSKVNICRDPKDNFLLALSEDGKADYLLTGDKGLLDLRKFGKTTITTITHFLEETKHYR
jgi:putative PIN family toxin of toxin-antitoxin system